MTSLHNIMPMNRVAIPHVPAAANLAGPAFRGISLTGISFLMQDVSRRILLLLLGIALLSHEVSADLIVTFTGSSGSPNMTVTGEGTITSTGSLANSINSSFLALPNSTPEWQTANLNVGDYLADTWTNFGSQGRELPLSGDLRLLGSGSAEFNYTFDHLRFDDDTAPGGDDLDLRFDSAQAYPDYPAGITVSMAGSSTFALADGNTFDDLILGTYSLGGFGASGNESVDFVITQAVPEPSSFVLMGLFTALCFRRRRTRYPHSITTKIPQA